MHLKDIIKAVLIIGAIIAIILFALSNLDDSANDNMGSAIDHRSSMEDTVNNV